MLLLLSPQPNEGKSAVILVAAGLTINDSAVVRNLYTGFRDSFHYISLLIEGNDGWVRLIN